MHFILAINRENKTKYMNEHILQGMFPTYKDTGIGMAIHISQHIL